MVDIEQLIFEMAKTGYLKEAQTLKKIAQSPYDPGRSTPATQYRGQREQTSVSYSNDLKKTIKVITDAINWVTSVASDPSKLYQQNITNTKYGGLLQEQWNILKIKPFPISVYGNILKEIQTLNFQKVINNLIQLENIILTLNERKDKKYKIDLPGRIVIQSLTGLKNILQQMLNLEYRQELSNNPKLLNVLYQTINNYANGRFTLRMMYDTIILDDMSRFKLSRQVATRRANQVIQFYRKYYPRSQANDIVQPIRI